MYVVKKFFKNLKKIYLEIKSFFKDYLTGSKDQIERYKKESVIYPFFKELNVNLVTSRFKLPFPKVGFLLRFLILLIVCLGLSLVRTIDRTTLEQEIKRGELVSKDLAVTAYYELKDLKRRQCTQKFNTYAKIYKVPLITFETEFRLLNAAIAAKDRRLAESLHLAVDNTKMYYKYPGFKKMVLVSDIGALHI